MNFAAWRWAIHWLGYLRRLAALVTHSRRGARCQIASLSTRSPTTTLAQRGISMPRCIYAPLAACHRCCGYIGYRGSARDRSPIPASSTLSTGPSFPVAIDFAPLKKTSRTLFLRAPSDANNDLSSILTRYARSISTQFSNSLYICFHFSTNPSLSEHLFVNIHPRYCARINKTIFIHYQVTYGLTAKNILSTR